MRLVSSLLKHVVYPVLHTARWLDRDMLPDGCAVVNYHGLVPADYLDRDSFLDGNLVSRESFRRQIQFLKARYQVISPERFRGWVEQGEALPPRAVLLTCDDGLLNTLTDMLPILQEEGVACQFFVTGASCRTEPSMLWYEELYHLLRAAQVTGAEVRAPNQQGAAVRISANFQTFWWELICQASAVGAPAREEWLLRLRNRFGDTRTSSSERRWRLLNAQELKQIADSGMSIGAHTLSHPVLSHCSAEEARREITSSKAELEQVLGRPVWAFAYPFGNPATMGDRETRLAQEAGFTCAFLNIDGRARRSEPFALARTHVTADMNIAEFEAHLTGFHARLQRAVRG